MGAIRKLLLCVGALCALACVGAPAGADIGSGLPLPTRGVDGTPPGANDWNCVPAQQHPRPVVLLHGTTDNEGAWAALSPELAADGYCVYTLDYGRDTSTAADAALGAIPGVYGLGDIAASAGEVAAFVERVLAATGARQVDLVGHSQGGPLARQYLRFDGGADPANPARNRVAHLITLGGTNHGVPLPGLAALGITGAALEPGTLPGSAARTLIPVAALQQVAGSDFLTRLDAGGDTEPGVAYTAIATRYDITAIPPQATFLTAGPGASVRNVWVQDLCSADIVEHEMLPFDPVVRHLVETALDPAYPAGHPVPCPGRGASRPVSR